MNIQQFRSWRSLVTTAAVLGCLIGLGGNSPFFNAQAQTSKKSIKLAPTLKSPLKLSELKVAGREIKFGEDFEAETDWIKNLSFKLENISGKRIVFLSVNVNFPETRLTGNMMSYAVTFGQRPGLPLPTIPNEPLLLLPNETINVSLDREKERLSKFVGERQSIETIQKIELEFSTVIFDDKTAWMAGSFMQQDPNNPRRYNPIRNEPQK
jgi:hypothetical protein